jgi:hypothetical protein
MTSAAYSVQQAAQNSPAPLEDVRDLMEETLEKTPAREEGEQ